MRIIGADYILTVSGDVLENHVIVLNDENKIVDILLKSTIDKNTCQHYSGWLTPGFINTHCHLELSHMKGMLHAGTGLIPFIGGVVTKRTATQEVIQDACQQADAAMWNAGIMAVGDISNTTDSFLVKQQSKIKYYTFVEVFDLMQPGNTVEEFEKSLAVIAEAPTPNAIVPHAPYSCTIELLNKIKSTNQGKAKTISIHNQETVHENNFFMSKTGELIDFYKSFNLQIDGFDAINNSSIHYLLSHLDPVQQHLLVHNTMTTLDDLHAANNKFDKLYWATCANANLYIENQLPNYRLFEAEGAKMTIGTDSLASNWQLSVWDELLAIKKYNSFLTNETLFQWACLNGAEALHMQDSLGSIEVGKSPGILHLETMKSIEHLITPDARPVRVI